MFEKLESGTSRAVGAALVIKETSQAPLSSLKIVKNIPGISCSSDSKISAYLIKNNDKENSNLADLLELKTSLGTDNFNIEGILSDSNFIKVVNLVESNESDFLNHGVSLNDESENLANLIDFVEICEDKIEVKMLEYGQNLSDLDDLENNDFLSNLALPKTKLNYVKIKLGSLEFAALIDSGAARSFISLPIKEQAEKLGFKVRKSRPSTVVSPLGLSEIVDENLRLPIQFQEYKQKLNFRVLPSMAFPCILGIDALRIFGINLFFGEDVYNFSANPLKYYKFMPDTFAATSAVEICSGLQVLSDAENIKLKEFLKIELSALSTKPGVTSLATHHIDVGDNKAIKQRYYPVSKVVEAALHEEVDKMLENGIIEPSNSDWSSPIVMVKRNGKYRFCLDFRKVNEVSKKDAYPLPYMSVILDRLRAAKYISTLDLTKAFHQVPLTPESKQITAFTVPGKGLFQFVTMPLGLSNSPATFQRLIDEVITPEMAPYCYAYLDDIIIATETFEEHLLWLKKVFHRLSEAGLILNPEKCEFCRAEVKYLGFVVNNKGLQVDPDKIAPIRDYPAPKNIRQVRRWMGMTSWYRRFIPDYATRMSPVTALLKKGKKWEWGPEQQRSFEDIKEKLMTAPVLIRPDFEKPFEIHCDASTVGLGAILTQKIEGVDHVIAYASRTLTDPERNYYTTELECLAVIWSMEKFRQYVEGQEVTVITDHAALTWLNNLKNPTGRLARWALRLLAHNIKIVHRKGSEHNVPDALSRMYEDFYEDSEVLSNLKDLNKLNEEDLSECDYNNWFYESWLNNELSCITKTYKRANNCEFVNAAEEINDEWYEKRISRVLKEPKKFLNWRVKENKLFHRIPDPFREEITRDGSDWKFVVPTHQREKILKECHDSEMGGHMGIDKTFERIRKDFFWPRMFMDISEYVKSCLICQKTKVSQQRAVGLLGDRVLEYPWCTVATDVMEFPRSKNGFTHLVVYQDLFTKWIELQPIRSANGKNIKATFDDLILTRWGAPRILLSDNGKEYINKLIKEVADEYNIHHSKTPPYHAQANPTERVNRVLKTMIVAFLGQDHRDWDLHVKEFRFAYNTATHSATKYTPAFLNFGREPLVKNSLKFFLEKDLKIEPSNQEDWVTRLGRVKAIRGWVAENMNLAHDRQAKLWDKKHRSLVYNVGDKVLSRSRVLSSAANKINAKLVPKFRGPLVISKVLSPLVYELSDENGRVQFRAAAVDLKPYRDSQNFSWMI